MKIDWETIQERFEKGETAYQISNSLGGRPTRQGIRARAKREDWFEVTQSAKEAARNLQVARVPSKDLGKRNERNAAHILSAIERGVSPTVAAGTAGLSKNELQNWVRRDIPFGREIRSRCAQVAAQRIGKVEDSNDWRAWKFLLENDPYSREEYGSRHTGDSGPTIVLNIQRDPVKDVKG